MENILLDFHLMEISTVNPSIATEVIDMNVSSNYGRGRHPATLHCGHGDLMGPLGLLVQGVLAFIAFTSLIIKRFCEPEPERRPWKIWFFDTSKQAIGAAVIHFANVFLADMFQGDPCTWYIVSFLLDSTIGLFVIWLGLKISQCIIKKKEWDTLTFGEYGNPPQCNSWVGQCGVYILVMLIEKVLMTLLVLLHFWKEVRRFIMAPIQDPHVELIIVMFIVPFVVNAFIFWVVDNFLKKKNWKSSSHTPINSNETAVKYFKAAEKVKYYGKANDDERSLSDCDVLLDNEEESDPEITHTFNGTVRPSGEQYSLLPSSNSIH